MQETIQKALSILMRQEIAVTGAGRTDTGVHARLYVAHFDCHLPHNEMEQENLVYKLNHILPKDIAIQAVIPVHNESHARFDAISRTYQYLICTEKDPFYLDRAWLVEQPLDLHAMQMASALLTGKKDFSSFAKSNSQVKTNLCNVTEAKWHAEEHLLLFTITADRFLRNMVRAIVGTLVDIGKGKSTARDFQTIIMAKDRSKAGYSAPGHGLYLVDIAYPYGL